MQIGAPLALDFVRFTMVSFSQDGHTAHVPVTPELASARYLVVYADPTFIGRAFVKEDVTYLAPAGAVFVPVSAPGISVPYTYEGRALVKIDTGS